MKSFRSRKCRPSSIGCTPRVETLEPRLLLACQAFQEDGVLTIVGDEADDVVKIVDDGRGNIELQCSERIPDPQIADDAVDGTEVQFFQGVNLVVALTDGGNDNVQYLLAPPLRPDGLSQDILPWQQPVDLRIATGAGADSLSVHCDAATGPVDGTAARPWTVEFLGGDGPDTGRMRFGSLTNFEKLNVYTDLGEGADRLKGNLGNMAVPTAVTVVAGPDDDIVRFQTLEGDQFVDSFFDISFDINLGQGNNLLALDGKGNDVAVKVQGGTGADKAIVRVKPVPASPANMTPNKLTAEINLGGGDDVARIQTLDGDFTVDSFFDVFCDVNLGNGNNLVALDGKGNDIALKVQGGTGADRAIVRVKPVPASPADMSPNKLTAEINLGGGDDVARIQTLDGDFNVDSFFDVFCDVNLGNGNNLVALDAKVHNAALNVRGGTGADRAIVRVKPVPASPANMTPNKLTAEINLGGGDDVARIQTLDGDFSVDSFFDVFCDVNLGNGNNLVAVDGKIHSASLNVLGGTGADKVRFKSIPVSPAGMEPSKLTAQINLAGGDDVVRIQTLDDDPTIDSFFDVFCDVDLGNGSNLVAIDGKIHSASLNVLGGTGADKVRFKFIPVSPAGVEPGKLTARINLGGGDDVARLETLNGDFNIDSFFDVFCDVDLGNGSNLVALDGKGNDVTVNVLGGRGVDRVQMNVLATGAVNSTILTGGGNDVVEADCALTPLRVDSRQTDGQVLPSSLQVFAGGGDDRVDLRITAPRDSNLTDEALTAELFGQAGDDLLILLAEDVQGRFLIDGGRGYDRYLASDNVTVRNCEEQLRELLMLLDSED